MEGRWVLSIKPYFMRFFGLVDTEANSPTVSQARTTILSGDEVDEAIAG